MVLKLSNGIKDQPTVFARSIFHTAKHSMLSELALIHSDMLSTWSTLMRLINFFHQLMGLYILTFKKGKLGILATLRTALIFRSHQNFMLAWFTNDRVASKALFNFQRYFLTDLTLDKALELVHLIFITSIRAHVLLALLVKNRLHLFWGKR